MEHRKQRNWMLAVMLVIAVAFSNVCPAIAAKLPDQTVLEKVGESEKPLGNEGRKGQEADDTEIHVEDGAGKVTEVSAPSNVQKPEAEEGLEEEENQDNLEESFKEENQDNLEESLKGENQGNIQEESDEAVKDKTPEDEKSKESVWIWSDREPVLMEAEEGEDLSGQFFDLSRASGVCPTYDEAYEAMISMKNDYPEGMRWTNFEPYGSGGEWGQYYRFRGGSVKGASLGVGCAAFVFALSDKAFGDLPARTIDKGGFQYEDVKVGDILRVNNNSHFVIVLRVSPGGVTVAEGNYNKSVHWGRVLSKSEVMGADFIVTRYPAGYSEEQDADGAAQSGTEGSLSWTLTKGGTLTISGKGAMPDYTENSRPSWEKYADGISQVIIEDGVESIGSYAFYDSQAMGVQIPGTVTSIGNGAFKSSALMEITVPGSVKAVGDEAFYNCQGLKSATFHEGVQSIGVNAFHKCAIAYLDFPSSITAVGSGAFMECDSLVQVRFAPGEQKVSLGNDLFSKCTWLSNVTLPLKADKISSGMFARCYMALTYLYIPAGVEVDGMGTSGSPFAGCGVLKKIDFGGTESEWNTNGGNSAMIYAYGNNWKDRVMVRYNVPFTDPFAPIPGDKGDLVACSHADSDGDGRCDICGSMMPAGPGSSGNPGNSGGGGKGRDGSSAAAAPAAIMYGGLDYSAVFDAEYYCNRYKDLKAAYGNDRDALFCHFLIHGMREGRQAVDTFNVSAYKARYTDLQKAFGESLPLYYQHYMQFGIDEKRNARS